MNTQNIDKAIAVMERATNLNMIMWQSHNSSFKIVNTIEDLHACGNTACFAGYIAISDEFKVDGGKAADAFLYLGGEPMIANKHGDLAIAHWLEIHGTIAHWFVHGKVNFDNTTSSIEYDFSLFYDKLWSEVKPSDVIEKLNELKELGEDAFFEKYDAL